MYNKFFFRNNMTERNVITMPNLTSKELDAIKEQADNEIVLIKKYRSFAEQSADSVLTSKWTQMADKHQQHYFTLMTHLN